jgi:DNA-binding transcriptional LysR family regulator
VGLSQSAVSTSLAKLREIYSDELLIMVGRRLELTEKGQQLVEQTERACQELELLLLPAAFDPMSETRRFSLCAADYITFVLAPRITTTMARLAPDASMHFVSYRSDLESQLLRGKIDIVAMPTSSAGTLNNQALSTPLFEDEIVIISSARSKIVEGGLTKGIYENSRHAMFRLAGETYDSHESNILRKAGIRQKDVVLVEQFLTLPAIVESSDCLALVQRRLAERFKDNYKISIHKAPFETPPVQIRAYWPRSADRVPAHRWFREQLIEAGENLASPHGP